MPETNDIDPRIQEFLESFAEQTRQLVEDGELEQGDAADLLNRYQTVARERHAEIVALIPQVGIDDAVFEAGQRYDAANADLRLGTLVTQFPEMRDDIISSQKDIISHMDRGLPAQDALYETEMARAGLNDDPGFRQNVEAAFSAGHYETRIEAAKALDHARDAAWLRSLGNETRAAHDNTAPRYVQDRQQDPHSDTPWQAPNLPPAYPAAEQPPAEQANANVARHASGPGQHNQQSRRPSEQQRPGNATGTGTPPPRHNDRHSGQGGLRRSNR
ncbi:hypothetical protein PV387_17735 [Streptomyces sp. ME02-6987-2C]|uniref:hypothetical protein n=1 Tax=unclassified Streptomyces TaxID=2593676 RepID=UPI0029BBCD2C|nr:MULTISPECIES: hypothetical protein [unclassified Streptomyces]MDX3367854.1 hypothetical protein [Streptomyces sp. ME02-6987-2C]MDX3426903.1 hypothetical protein [Streptomyces sp. ME02-6985-2c]